MATLGLRGIRKSFGTTEVLRGVDLDVDEGEFVVFVGPSGCGKSTLLRLVSGLEQPDAGDVLLDGERVNDATPFERGVAMVFQSYALYPHMSVAENMAFPLRMADEPEASIAAKVRAAAEVLHLEALLARRPHELSGGQKQRVAMGRTIVRNPRLFLFDEPLSNLDADLRIEMRVEIEKLHQRLAATMIYVTHDQVEAMTLADRIVVLRDGAVEQIGAPIELYENPANTFVAGFLGAPKINFLAARLVGATGASTWFALGDGAEIEAPVGAEGLSPGTPLVIGIRPEDLSPGSGDFRIPFAMELQERLGPTSYLHGTSGGDRIIAEHRTRGVVSAGEVPSLGVAGRNLHLFDAGGRSLRHLVHGARP